MSNAILVIGESGTGKSTSIRNLDNKETFIINVLGKTLPFKGANKTYSNVSQDWSEGNSYSSSDNTKVIKAIKYINNSRLDIKNLIIDDFIYLMSSEFMEKALIKGFDKFSEMAKNAWDIIRCVSSCRDDLFCVILTHSETTNEGKVKCKTLGKMLDDKINIEGMFTTVLHSLIVDGEYKFLTQNNGQFMAKSPMGMFDKKLIDNDLSFAKQRMTSYLDEDIL